MQSLNIGYVVACGCTPHFPEHFTYLQIPIKDDRSVKIDSYIVPVANFIAAGLAEDRAVLVYCKAGICRSSTMILAYLLTHRRDLVTTPLAAMCKSTSRFYECT